MIFVLVDSCHIDYFFIDVLVAVRVGVPGLVLVLDHLAVQLVVDYDLELAVELAFYRLCWLSLMRHIEFPMNNFNHVVMNIIVPANNTRSSSIIYCLLFFIVLSVTVISLFLIQQINDLGKATILFSGCFIYACMYNYLNRSQFLVPFFCFVFL